MKNRFVIPPETTSTTRIVELANRDYMNLKTYKAWGKVIVEALGRSYSLGAHVIVNRPDTLFIRLEAMFGMDVGWLFADRNFYTFYLPMQNSYFTGATDSLTMNTFLDFSLRYDQLLTAVTGGKVLYDLQQPQSSRQGNLIILTGRSDLGRHRYKIDSKKGVVIEAEIYNDRDQVILVEKYERFGKISGLHVPRTIRIHQPLEQQALTFFYEQLKVNQKLSAKDFKRTIPGNARKRTWY